MVNSTFNEHDANINNTDLITIVGDFVNNCSYDENQHKFIKNLEFYVFRVIVPSYLGLGAIANFLVIIFFLQMYKKKISKMRPYHFLIVNLAIVDLLVCVLVPVVISRTYRTLEKFECLFLANFARRVCPSASFWLLVLLAYARYRLIVKPFRRKLEKKACCIVVFIVWIFSFAASSYWFSTHRYSESEGCLFKKPTKKTLIFRAVFFVFHSTIPLILMWYFPHKIEEKLSEYELDTNIVLRNRKALKTLRFLLVIFAVTVIPGHIVFLVTYTIIWMEGFMIGFWIWIPYVYPVYLLSVVLFFSNNVVNVFVYIKMFPGFRRFLLKIFTFGRCGKNEQQRTKTIEARLIK